ncbi:MAG: hypothetical protein NW205_03460 [Hyphomicrobiaceae bacterium]|nr:hypothetical protein [Hyphomicrobiaceae bacterium]
MSWWNDDNAVLIIVAVGSAGLLVVLFAMLRLAFLLGPKRPRGDAVPPPPDRRP